MNEKYVPLQPGHRSGLRVVARSQLAPHWKHSYLHDPRPTKRVEPTAGSVVCGSSLVMVTSSVFSAVAHPRRFGSTLNPMRSQRSDRHSLRCSAQEYVRLHAKARQFGNRHQPGTHPIPNSTRPIARYAAIRPSSRHSPRSRTKRVEPTAGSLVVVCSSFIVTSLVFAAVAHSQRSADRA